MWRHHYKELFNCIQENNFARNGICNLNVAYSDDIPITESEVAHAINKLDNHKSCGLDGIYAEHLRYCSNKILPMLSMCFSSLCIHGVLPDSLVAVVLVPIIKNKSESVCNKNNYRPIALASVISKVLEYICL